MLRWFIRIHFAKIRQFQNAELKTYTFMKKLKITVLFAALVVAFACVGCGESPTAKNVATSGPNKGETPLPTATVDELASGKKVFETNCAACHKTDGTGGKVRVEDKSLDVEDLTSGKIKGFSDEKIIGYIIKGVPDEGMPAFRDKLSEGEIRDVVLYVRKEFHDR